MLGHYIAPAFHFVCAAGPYHRATMSALQWSWQPFFPSRHHLPPLLHRTSYLFRMASQIYQMEDSAARACQDRSEPRCPPTQPCNGLFVAPLTRLTRILACSARQPCNRHLTSSPSSLSSKQRQATGRPQDATPWPTTRSPPARGLSAARPQKRRRHQHPTTSVRPTLECGP